MSWSYSCPHCQAGLNPDDTVIVVGECGGTRVLVGFHPEPGNYKAYVPPGIPVVAGARWAFYCPVCAKNFATEISGGLCALVGPHEGGTHRVYFSPVAGEQATFLVSEDGVVERHGRDVQAHSLDLLDQI